MSEVYDHAGVRILVGDCRALLAGLEAESVQTCVTSPPYYGLRDYGTATWDGGDPECDHRSPTMRDGRNEDRPLLAGSAASNAAQLLLAARSICGICGARRIDQQIGLDETPAEYVDALVAVFREVRRVLRKDGTPWLNLGSSYAGGNTGNQSNVGQRYGKQSSGHAFRRDTAAFRAGNPEKNGGVSNRDGFQAVAGFKPKDLIPIPWLVGLALQADGWWLRQAIIWSKPNPMPESVTDRCTSAHEYVLLLAKSERYLYQAEAIAEPAADEWLMDQARREQRLLATGGAISGGTGSVVSRGTTRNKRSVWIVQPKPFPEAHFATFPTKLIEPCILAGSRPGDVVLDPFSGAGTTLLVSKQLERRAVGIELNPQYAEMAARRLAQDVLPLDFTL